MNQYYKLIKSWHLVCVADLSTLIINFWSLLSLSSVFMHLASSLLKTWNCCLWYLLWYHFNVSLSYRSPFSRPVRVDQWLSPLFLLLSKFILLLGSSFPQWSEQIEETNFYFILWFNLESVTVWLIFCRCSVVKTELAIMLKMLFSSIVMHRLCSA